MPVDSAIYLTHTAPGGEDVIKNQDVITESFGDGKETPLRPFPLKPGVDNTINDVKFLLAALIFRVLYCLCLLAVPLTGSLEQNIVRCQETSF